MRKRGLLLLSLLISLLTHTILISFSYYIWIPGISQVAAESLKLFEVQKIELAPPLAAERPAVEDYTEKIKFQTPSQSMIELLDPGVMKPQKIVQPTQQELITEPEMFELEQAPPPELETAASLPPPPLPEPELPVGTRSTELRETRPALELFEPAGPIAPGESKIVVPQEFVHEMPELPSKAPVFEAASPLGKRSDVVQGALANIADQHAFRPTPSYESLDEFLGVNLYVYRDPSDGQGYYQLSIYPKPNAPSIEVMPKEVIFLIDASLSMKYKRLNGFKEGIQYAIERLNPPDLFNVFVFKNKITPMSPKSLSPEPETVMEAMRFIEELQPSQTTDIYNALHDAIKKPAAFYPSYIIFISDGKATEGIRSTTKLLSEITRYNNLKRPIYSFSAGKGNDRFLLDFLAYPNRGWAEHADDLTVLPQTFRDFYDKIRNPILVDVKYQLTPLSEAEVYPKNLPDFFRDTLFTLYGKFDQETKFSIRIVGNIGDRTKEFIFSNDLQNASAGNGSIARYWAFNKIYHLISEMTMNGFDPAYVTEIEELSRKYGVEIPYDLKKIF